VAERDARARLGHVPQGPAAEHPAVEQRPGGDSEAGARGGLALSDADRERCTSTQRYA
jgi:hypothetical protein